MSDNLLDSLNISIPADAIFLHPTDDIKAIIESSAAGKTFVFTPGVYHTDTIHRKDGQSFLGQTGAVLSGAVEIGGWAKGADGLWVADGFPPPAYTSGYGRDGMAAFREDLIVDGTPWVRVASKAELGAGKFYYENGHVYINSNPAGSVTEASKVAAAFEGASTKGVTIANLTVEYFAVQSQHGAINAGGTDDWTLVNVTAQYNHSDGVRAGSNMTILGGDFSNNGQGGIRAQDVTNLHIEGVKAANNNYAGFDPGWDAGGIKILTSTNVTVTNSEIAGNKGAGIWFDWDNKNVVISNNYVHGNDGAGIQIEASYDTKVTGNVVELNNRSGEDVGYWGSDLLVQNSSNVSVTGNHVTTNVGQGIGLIYDPRDPGVYGAHVTQNVSVSGNTIVMLVAGKNGFAASADTALMYNGSNSFDGNTYYAAKADNLQFTWNDKWFTAPYLDQHPIEAHGKINIVANPSAQMTGNFLHPDPVPVPNFDTAGDGQTATPGGNGGDQTDGDTGGSDPAPGSGTETGSDTPSGNTPPDTSQPPVGGGANHAPVIASQQSLTTSANTALTISASASDADGDALTYTFRDSPHGTIVNRGNGTALYTPDSNYTGTDSLLVVVTDGKGGSVSQTVNITVTGANHAPTLAATQAVTTGFETTATVTVAASDQDGDALSYFASNAAHGTVTKTTDGIFVYTPDAGYSGSDSFMVAASDGKGGSARQTVSITVLPEAAALPGNHAPVTLGTQTVTAQIGKQAALRIEASDADGDTLTYTSSNPAHGAVSVHSGGMLIYTPAAGYSGSDTFIVHVADGKGGIASTTVDVTVSDVKAPSSATGSTTDPGFVGTFGGMGTIYGGNAFQKIIVADTHDDIVFDPSFNRGGDVIEFPHAAASYIISATGSQVIIRDGDSTYTIPVGIYPVQLQFSDGTRGLGIDQESSAIRLGGQIITGDAAPITAPPGTSASFQQIDPNAHSVLTLAADSDVTLGGNYTVYGTSGDERISYLQGDLDLDPSFGRGGDVLHLPGAASDFSAYVTGTILVLVAGGGEIHVPMGTGGITLDFAGDERTAFIDTATAQIRIGDIAITATNEADALLADGSASLDTGQAGHPVLIALADNAAYTLTDDAGRATFVTVNGFDADDVIAVRGAAAAQYSFETVNDADLRIAFDNGGTVNEIILEGVWNGGSVHDYASAAAALGHDFMTFG